MKFLLLWWLCGVFVEVAPRVLALRGLPQASLVDCLQAEAAASRRPPPPETPGTPLASQPRKGAREYALWASHRCGLALAPGQTFESAAKRGRRSREAATATVERGLFGKPRWQGFPQEKKLPKSAESPKPTIMTATTLMEMMEALDTEPPSPDVLDIFVTKFKNVGITLPGHLSGLMESEAADLVESLAHKSFMRRLVRAASAQVAPPPAAAAAAVSSSAGQLATMAPSTSSHLATMEEHFGAAASDLASAMADVPPTEQKTAMDLLGFQCSFSGLPFQLQLSSDVYKAMYSDVLKARKENRSAFTFVDLTSREFSPSWVTASSIGGQDRDTVTTVSDDKVAKLSDIGAALCRSLQRPRSYRRAEQWTGAYIKYAAAAVSTEQLTLVQIMSYLNVVLKMANDETVAGRPSGLAWLYDSMFREALAKRAKNHEILDFDREMSRVSEEILSSARSRLASSLQTSRSGSSASPVEGSSEVLRASISANKSLQTQIDKANKQLQQQQRSLESRTAAASSSGEKPRTPDKRRSSGGGFTEREKKRQDWWKGHSKR